MTIQGMMSSCRGVATGASFGAVEVAAVGEAQVALGAAREASGEEGIGADAGIEVAARQEMKAGVVVTAARA